VDCGSTLRRRRPSSAGVEVLPVVLPDGDSKLLKTRQIGHTEDGGYEELMIGKSQRGLSSVTEGLVRRRGAPACDGHTTLAACVSAAKAARMRKMIIGIGGLGHLGCAVCPSNGLRSSCNRPRK